MARGALHTTSGRRRLRAAARALLDGFASPETGGLLLRGWRAMPLTSVVLEEPGPRGAAARGLLRLSRLADVVAEDLRDHPDPAVRLAAACLAARAHPIRVGLEPPDA